MSLYRPTILLLLFFAFLQGCDKYHEQKEVDKERLLLEQQRKTIYDAINSVTGGRTDLTEEQKARARPLWIELRKVDDRLKSLHVGLQDNW